MNTISISQLDSLHVSGWQAHKNMAHCNASLTACCRGCSSRLPCVFAICCSTTAWPALPLTIISSTNTCQMLQHPGAELFKRRDDAERPKLVHWQLETSPPSLPAVRARTEGGLLLLPLFGRASRGTDGRRLDPGVVTGPAAAASLRALRPRRNPLLGLDVSQNDPRRPGVMLLPGLYWGCDLPASRRANVDPGGSAQHSSNKNFGLAPDHHRDADKPMLPRFVATCSKLRHTIRFMSYSLPG